MPIPKSVLVHAHSEHLDDCYVRSVSLRAKWRDWDWGLLFWNVAMRRWVLQKYLSGNLSATRINSARAVL